MIYKTYKGARIDIELYKSKATIDFWIEVFNDDETETDLTIYSDITLTIAHKIHGTVVLTLVEDDGGIQLGSPVGNSIFLNVSDSQTDALRPKEYWYECFGTREDDEKELICFGIAKVL